MGILDSVFGSSKAKFPKGSIAHELNELVGVYTTKIHPYFSKKSKLSSMTIKECDEYLQRLDEVLIRASKNLDRNIRDLSNTFMDYETLPVKIWKQGDKVSNNDLTKIAKLITEWHQCLKFFKSL